MVKAGSNVIAMEGVRDKVNALIQAHDATKSLFNHLRSSGLIRQLGPDDGEPKITFGFERLYDFHVAQKILHDYPTMQAVVEDLERKGKLYMILSDQEQFWRNAGLIGAFSILFPEKFGAELIELFESPVPPTCWSAFCDSIRWRKGDCITDRTEEILHDHGADSVRFMMENFIDLAAVPDKRFNADYIHLKLSKMTLREREIEWTLKVSEETFYERWCQLNQFVDWCTKVPSERLSSEQARLSLTLLSWCFSSTHVPFRDKATSAAIHVLCSHPDIVPTLLDSFAQSDDPYIRERIYAVAAGVATRCPSPAAVRAIAARVSELFFNVREVNPHLLMRDYARCVMERALAMDVLPEGVSPSGFRPPYTSVWPKITTTDDDIEKLAHEDHAWALISSMRLESEGVYGDFGRYEFGSRIGSFSRFKRDQKYPRRGSSFTHTFDEKVAKRYLFDRVFELGWTPEGLGKREKSLFPDYYSRARPTVERVSKKYQWIALHEVLGYLTDHYQPLRWSWTEQEKTIEARGLFCRDFDPSVDPVTETDSAERARVSAPWWCHVNDPLKDPSDGSQWLFSDALPEVARILQPPDAEDNTSWLTLCGYYEWSDYANARQVDDQALYRYATLRILSWMVPSRKRTRLLRDLRRRHLYGAGLDVPTLTDCWIGEYPWAPSCKHFADRFEGLPECISQIKECALTAAFIGPSSALAPAPQTLSLLQASWAGEAADFVATRPAGAKIVAMNPAIHKGKGPQACLVDKALITQALAKNRLSLVWATLGEKTILGGETWCGSFEFSGVYRLEHGSVKGDITQRIKRLPGG